jgi:ATP-dependent DNA helicase RecG
VSDDDGTVRDKHEYPLDAFRELIGNALVHRDLAEWSRGLAVEVRHLPDRIVVTNPGGLFGISVDRLGTECVTSARNGRLLHHLPVRALTRRGRAGGRGPRDRDPDRDRESREGRAAPAQFINTAIRFTVILRPGPSSTKRPVILGRSALAVWEAIDGEKTVDEIKASTGLSTANVRRILRDLRDDHFIAVTGGVGRPTTYRRVSK